MEEEVQTAYCIVCSPSDFKRRKLHVDGRTDKWMNDCRHGRTERRTDGRVRALKDRRTHCRTDEGTNQKQQQLATRWKERKRKLRTKGLTEGCIDERTEQKAYGNAY